MNRRSFLSTVLAGVVAPAFLPGAGRLWKRTESGLSVPKRAVINPAWVNAPYEVAFHWTPNFVHDVAVPPQVLDKIAKGQSIKVQDYWPMRFADAAGTQPIPPFIVV